MIVKVRLLLLWLAFIPLGINAQGINDILTALRSEKPFAADAVITVMTPAAPEAIEQTMKLHSSPSADTIAPCNYIIEVTTGNNEAFAALLSPTLYRYDGRRFSEYSSTEGTLTPELAAGMPGTEFLPPFIAKEIEAANTNPNIVISTQLTPDGNALIVELSTVVGGEECARRTYTLRKPDLIPLRIENITSKNTPMETSLEAVITPLNFINSQVDEAMLMERHGEIINRFASTYLCPENFIGYPLPPFTLPDTRGTRYTYNPGNPTIIMIVDPEADPEAIENAQQKFDIARREDSRLDAVDIIYIGRQRYIDALRASDGASPRQRVLLGGEALMRTLNATHLPLVMTVDVEGRVLTVAEGANNVPFSFVFD